VSSRELACSALLKTTLIRAPLDQHTIRGLGGAGGYTGEEPSIHQRERTSERLSQRLREIARCGRGGRAATKGAQEIGGNETKEEQAKAETRAALGRSAADH